jgi:hypothetical protein
MERRFLFAPSCRYIFGDEDQHDNNKLFGFSVGHHHKNSYRFAWKYDPAKDKIGIWAYMYLDGERHSSLVTYVQLRKFYHFKVSYFPKKRTLHFEIDGCGYSYKLLNNQLTKTGFGYTLGPYFGGNRTAPKEMIIYQDRG